ncbi:hypothetical protein DFH09DRAFT_1280488 [Mycena vulgaris]|nr:hypothetical protein DFH09DRAFT_1280488 [Mycena vulgaris]
MIISLRAVSVIEDLHLFRRLSLYYKGRIYPPTCAGNLDMSDSQALIKELETVLTHTAISRYTIVSSLCLYVYDFSRILLGMHCSASSYRQFPNTIDHQGSPWSLVKGMFFWNRYFIFPVVAYWTFSEITRVPTDRIACFAGGAVGLIFSLICNGGAQVIMQLRVHAMYGHNRTLKIVISLLFLVAISTELGIAIAKLATDHGILPMMTFDTILLILVVYKAYLIQRQEIFVTSNRTWNGARLMRIMFRDSVIYFACTVGVNLFNLLMWAVGPYDLFTMGAAWAITVPVMAASHILFNMRRAYHRPIQTLATTEGDEGTEFQIAHRLAGAKGPTVWSRYSVHVLGTQWTRCMIVWTFSYPGMWTTRSD